MNLFDQGRQAFNHERYFEAHELWEELWTPMQGQERRRLQGLIHFAVGLYHLDRGNWIGASRQLHKGLDKTADCPADWRGIELEQARKAITGLLTSIESGEEHASAVVRL